MDGSEGVRWDSGSSSVGAGGVQATPTLSQHLGAAGAGSRARDKLRLNLDADVGLRRSPKLTGMNSVKNFCQFLKYIRFIPSRYLYNNLKQASTLQ